jgi:hypothetical protein
MTRPYPDPWRAVLRSPRTRRSRVEDGAPAGVVAGPPPAQDHSRQVEDPWKATPKSLGPEGAWRIITIWVSRAAQIGGRDGRFEPGGRLVGMGETPMLPLPDHFSTDPGGVGERLPDLLESSESRPVYRTIAKGERRTPQAMNLSPGERTRSAGGSGGFATLEDSAACGASTVVGPGFVTRDEHSPLPNLPRQGGRLPDFPMRQLPIGRR